MTSIRRHSFAIALFIAIVCAYTGPLFAFEVETTFPVAHDVSVLRDSGISVQFSESVDPNSIDELSFRVSGEQGGPIAGNVTIDLDSVSFEPTNPFFAGDLIHVRLSTLVRSSDGESLTKPYGFSFRTDVTPSALGLQNMFELSVAQSSGLYAGDLNRDGSLDLVVLSEKTGGDNVSVFLNDGSGAYGRPFVYSAGDRPVEVEGGDFDADGDIDLAVTSRTSNDMTIFSGRGDGTFDPGVRVPTGDQGEEMTIFDLEGDGDLDIVTVGCEFGICEVHVSINNGLGDFPNVELLGTKFWWGVGVQAEDMDNDGVSDLLVGFTNSEGYGNGTLSVFLARGGAASYVGSSRILEAVERIDTADFNGDGIPDVVFMENLSWLAVALSESPGIVEDFRFYSWAPGHNVGLGDMEGDGDLDIVSIGTFSPDIGIMENDGLGTFTEGQMIAEDGYENIVVYDRDGDGDLDAVVTAGFGSSVVFYDNP